MPSPQHSMLRPMERRILAMLEQGESVSSIATKFRKSQGRVRQIIRWTDIERPAGPSPRRPSALERRILTLRANGIGYDEIGRRLRRSPRFIRQVEGLAHIRNGTDQTVFDHGRSLLKAAAAQARTEAAARRSIERAANAWTGDKL